MNTIISEVTPLGDRDCFYLVDRYKDQFNYPIHRHNEYELNFVANCRGARRVVGDSFEVLGDYDLALLGGGIEHTWEQHECSSVPIREITIQFSRHLFGDTFLSKKLLLPIRRLLESSDRGIVFEMPAIMRAYNLLDNMTRHEDNFARLIEFISVLHILAMSNECHTLASTSFAKSSISVDSRRVQRVANFINEHIKEELRLADLAHIADMSPTSFSRFFKLRTGRTIFDYIGEIRLGLATRALVDSSMTVAEICYDCGFNNISHFNRLFKRKKGCSPTEFRETYKRHKVLV